MLLKFNVKSLVFVVALSGVYEFEVQRLFRQFGSGVLALVFPNGGVYEVFVVTLGFALFGLVLYAEVAAARLLAVECVSPSSRKSARRSAFSSSTLKSFS